MPPVWRQHMVVIALVGAAFLFIGWLYDRPFLGLLIGVSLVFGWHLMWLYRLHRWVGGEPMRFLPEGSGVWSQVFARIDFIRARSRRRNRRFKTLVKQMRRATNSFPDGGVVLSADDEIITMNTMAEELLGLKRKADRGLRIASLVRVPEFVDYLDSEDHTHPVEFESPLYDDRWLSCHIVPYALDQKLLLVRDVTQQHRAHEMRRDFVANASHELRTPLTVITGYLDAFHEDPSISEDLKGPIAEMQKQSNRMRALVDELLVLSELESESLAPESHVVGMAAVIKTATQEARAMEGCPRDISADIQPGVDLKGDEADIQSIVSNLTTNAVKYTPADGRIMIRWWADDEGGHLSVEDTGVGIAREHLPRLTERFYRVEDGRQRIGGEGGTGLGLAIVKHALARHDGVLDISSELGKGSTFRCDFPPDRLVTG